MHRIEINENMTTADFDVASADLDQSLYAGEPFLVHSVGRMSRGDMRHVVQLGYDYGFTVLTGALQLESNVIHVVNALGFGFVETRKTLLDALEPFVETDADRRSMDELRGGPVRSISTADGSVSYGPPVSQDVARATQRAHDGNDTVH